MLLSGDNALVIAMACRGLAPRQRLWGMTIGAGIAVVLLIAFTGIVATLMVLPYLKLVGGLALLLIAAKLLVPDEEGDDVTAGTSLWHAIRIVVIADIIMSLDNVIAVAAAANGELALLVLGLAISIPMIIAGAALIMLVLDRFPILVWLGATLLGWIAGDVIATDPAVQPAAGPRARWQDRVQSRCDFGGFRLGAASAPRRRSRRIYLLGAGRGLRSGGGLAVAATPLASFDQLVVPVAGEAARPVDPA